MLNALLLAVVTLTAPETELQAKLPEIFAKSAAHYRAIDQAARPINVSPVELTQGCAKTKLLFPHGYKRTQKRLDMRSINWWTSGHFAGALWYLYEGTGAADLKDLALFWTERLAPNSTADSNHDLGFIMNCSYGNARRLLQTDKYDRLLVETAGTLGRRFHRGLGLIRSWGRITDDKDFLVIPDNLMNLELLEVAAKLSGNKDFAAMAKSHADVSMVHHFRPDGGCRHVLNYDQRTKRVKEIRRGQGASCETAWSRGQSWAIYGYAMMYRETRDRRYLQFACKLADYAINHPNMPADGVPYWDFGAPGEERDTSAASCMAAGLLELADYVAPREAAGYRAFAVKQLLSLASPEYFSEGDEIGHFLLKHGVGNLPGGSEVDTPLVYGDYYFLEALIRFRNYLKYREGPVTTSRELLTRHLDTSVPQLKAAAAAAESGDMARGEKLLADFIRQEPTLSRLETQLTNDRPSAAGLRKLTAEAQRIMSLKLSAVGFTYDFSKDGLDWVVNPTRGSYQEWPWQLSRHHDLLLLAQYYHYTKDENAVRTWVKLMDSWLDQAKFPFDGSTEVSRACWRTLDAGIRVRSWDTQLAVFRHSPLVSDHLIVRIARSIYEHGSYLRYQHQLDGNWVMHEMVGQTHMLLFVRFLKERQEWLDDAQKVLKEQYYRQIYPDGWQVELTTDYQTSVLDSGFVAIINHYRDAGETPPDYILSQLDRAYRVYIHLRRPDGRAAPVNDGGDPSVRNLCSAALKVYPNDPEFRYFATDGQAGTPPKWLSAASEYSGYVTFRNSWGPNAVWGFFDAGDDYFRSWHMHDDALNFTLSAYGRNMIVEPGNYRYDRSEMRKYAVSTPSHNTILIDGLGQCRKLTNRARNFSLRRKPAFEFRTTPKFDFARHRYQEGYGHFQHLDVRHQRTVYFVKDFAGLKPFFAIVDELSGNPGRHAFDILWHLNAGAKVKLDGNRFVGDFANGVTLAGVSSDPAAYVDMCGSTQPFQGWSPVWNEEAVERHHPIATPVQKGEFDTFKRIVTILQPNEKGETSPIAGVAAAERDTAFVLRLRDGRQLRFEAEGVPGPQISVFGCQLMDYAKAKGITAEAAVQTFRAAGINGFDCDYADPWIAELVNAGLRPVNFYADLKFLTPDNGAKQIDALVAAADQWQVKLIMALPEEFSGKDDEGEFARIVSGFRRLVAKAKTRGITVTTEDYGWHRPGKRNACGYAKWILKLLKACPDLKFTVDTGNLMYTEGQAAILPLVEATKDRTVHCHLKDEVFTASKAKYRTLGAGAVPNEEIVRKLEANGYNGWYTLENLVGDDLLEDAQAQLKTLKNWCRK